MGEPVTAQELFDAIGAGYEAAFGRPPVVDRAVRQLMAVLPPSARSSTSEAGRATRWRGIWPPPDAGSPGWICRR
jgi:hypothetical protein